MELLANAYSLPVLHEIQNSQIQSICTFRSLEPNSFNGTFHGIYTGVPDRKFDEDYGRPINFIGPLMDQVSAIQKCLKFCSFGKGLELMRTRPERKITQPTDLRKFSSPKKNLISMDSAEKCWILFGF